MEELREQVQQLSALNGLLVDELEAAEGSSRCTRRGCTGSGASTLCRSLWLCGKPVLVSGVNVEGLAARLKVGDAATSGCGED